MRKGPGFIARMYRTGRESFLEAAHFDYQGTIMGRWTGDYLSQDMDFARAAGKTLAAVSADPRNHFGKHALRRFDK